MTQATRSISVTDTARLIRVELKNAFPGIKFSVRSSSYAGGASIRIEWMDGPTSDEVEVVTKRFEGASFDGMVDLKSYKDSELNGESVHFGADYVFTDRLLSEAFLTKVAIWYCNRFGYPMPKIVVSNHGGSAYMESNFHNGHDYLPTLIYREHRQISEKDVDDIDGFFARVEAEKEAQYQAYLAEQEAKKQATLKEETLVMVVERLEGEQKRVRILLAGSETSFKMVITGELGLWMERFDAVLVSTEDFEAAIELRGGNQC